VRKSSFVREPLTVANATKVITRSQRRGLAVPALCAGLALAAAGLRFMAARSIPGPWYVDEFVYAASARAISGDWTLLVRDFGANFYLYPRLLAPAWTANAMATTYALAQAINVVVMTLAVVPVYLWACRLLPPWGRVAAVALVLAMPTGLYVATLVTENAFFPAFLLGAFALAAALERPTTRTQLLALAAIGLACSIRLQGLVFALIVPSAIGGKVALDLRDSSAGFSRTALAREVRRYLPMLAVAVAVACAYAIWKLARGGAVSGGLGIYAPAIDVHRYSAAQTFRWILYHFGALAIVVGFIPFCAWIFYLSAVTRKEVPTTAAERAFVAVSTSAVVWVAIQVGIFSSRRAERISERYMFHIEPLLLLVLLVWIHRGAPRKRPAIAVLLPLALILTLPLEQLLANDGVLSETFGFIPLVRSSHILHGVDELRIALATLAGVAAIGVIILPFRVLRLAAPAAVFLYLVAASLAIVGPLREYARGFRGGVRVGPDPEWIDHAVPRGSRLDVLYKGARDPTIGSLRLRFMQFWNRRVTIVHELAPLAMCCMTQAPARVDGATGRILLGGAARPPHYVVAIPPLDLQGTVIRRYQRAVLYRATKPLRLRSR
jgi:hypothetical protein